MKWVRPSQIHLTLHFFGSVESKVLGQISERVLPIVRETKPLSFFLSGIGAFPDLRRPRVIWLGMGGEVKTLQSLQASLERALKKEGFECEKRAFKPHLTLGRVEEGIDLPNFQAFPFGPTQTKEIEEIILFQSHLTPAGATYEAIATYPFSPA